MTDAIAQLKRIRWWRREVETLIAGVIVASLLWPAWVVVRHRGSFHSATWWFLVGIAIVGMGYVRDAFGHAEGRLLAVAAGDPVGEPAPMDLHRRVGPWRRMLTASAWLIGGVVWAWLDSADRHLALSHRGWLFYLVAAAVTSLFVVGALVPFRWSSDLGRLDETGLTLRDADLKVPWRQIEYVSAKTSVGEITWHLVDGWRLGSESAKRPQQVQIDATTLRERPEDVIRVSGQYLLAARAAAAGSPEPETEVPA